MKPAAATPAATICSPVSEFGHELNDDVDDGRWIARRSGASLETQDAARLVHEGSGDLGSPDIDSDRVHLRQPNSVVAPNSSRLSSAEPHPAPKE